MKGIFTKALFVIAMLSIIGGITLTLFTPPASYSHTGKYLMDEETYISFKQLMALESTEIISMGVLNDGYPKLVNFSFNSKDKNNLYNEDISKNYQEKWIYLILCSIPCMMISYLIAPKE